VWRTLSFPMNEMKPSVKALKLHTPGEQQVLFHGGLDEDDLANVCEAGAETQLTAFFAQAKDERRNAQQGQPNPMAYEMIYTRMPEYYRWFPRTKKWRRFKNVGQQHKTIGRLRIVSPGLATSEIFHLRMLLTIVKGPTSFEDLRTYPRTGIAADRTVHETFQLACLARGLIEDDKEWDAAMEEASVSRASPALRQLFVTILQHCNPSKPRDLWEKYKALMAEDFAWKRRIDANIRGPTVIDADVNRALLDIESRLAGGPPKYRTLAQNNLPGAAPLDPDSGGGGGGGGGDPREVREALDFSVDDAVAATAQAMKAMAGNPSQLDVFNKVDGAVRDGLGTTFFVDAAGGTGKTFLAEALIHSAHARGQIVLPMASSGIAALLLPGGRTAHSTCRIPVRGLDKDTTLAVTMQSGRGQLLKRAALIIWDEAPMVHRHALEAIERSLRLLRENTAPFGGVTFMLMGDFRQVLPVVPRGCRGQVVRASMKYSSVWKHVTQLTLTTNMRVVLARRRGADATDAAAYSDFLLQVGDGTFGQPTEAGLAEGTVRIPAKMLLPDVQPTNGDDASGGGAKPAGATELIEWVFGDKPTDLPQVPDDTAEYRQTRDGLCRYYRDKAILAPKHVFVDDINERVLDTLPGERLTFLSADSIAVGDANATRYPVEFLNTIDLSGMPRHKLQVKVGAVLMCMRNLSPRDGLCNGTRFVLTRATARVLEGVIIQGSHLGTEIMVPRIPLEPSQSRFPFTLRRLQFPVKVAFAMTINKSQGQSLDRVGLYLPRPVFTHGQLYVALSRSGNPPAGRLGVRIVVHDLAGKQGKFEGQDGVYTQNEVYEEVLRKSRGGSTPAGAARPTSRSCHTQPRARRPSSPTVGATCPVCKATLDQGARCTTRCGWTNRTGESKYDG
jgi:hypothetical protein